MLDDFPFGLAFLLVFALAFGDLAGLIYAARDTDVDPCDWARSCDKNTSQSPGNEHNLA